jgi:hydroxyacylglutathione hydrolase
MHNKLVLPLRIFMLTVLVSCQASTQDRSLPSAVFKLQDGNKPLNEMSWAYTSKDCPATSLPPILIYQKTASSFIIRQHKCSHFEAPFMYLFIGSKKAMLVDTGASADTATFAIYDIVQKLMAQTGDSNKELVVIHTHSHKDHYAGDQQFNGKENVNVVGTKQQEVQNFYAFKPDNSHYFSMDLGEREVIIIPTAGHQEESITIYDPVSQWLLTGDTFYPGKIYVKNWQAYKNSITRLAQFIQTHKVKWILGAHIEMNAETNTVYPIGTIYQPQESALALTVSDLIELDKKLSVTQQAQVITTKKWVIVPMGLRQKTLSGLARWITQL